MTAVVDEGLRLTFDRASLARVNLLPPEIEEERRFRRIRTGLCCGIALTVGAVAATYVVSTAGVGAATQELAVQESRSSTLQQSVAGYDAVTEVYARSADAKAMLATAMGEEVRFSRLLSDLSLTVPENVWLRNITFAQGSVAAAAVPAREQGIGTVTFTGVGFSHDDVAVWLESLADQAGYEAPYFSSSSESELGDRKVVEFASTATLTRAALSGRYAEPAGD